MYFGENIQDTHTSLETSPFYYKLCNCRYTAQEYLEKHVLNSGPHKTIKTEYPYHNRESDFDIEKFIFTNPYYETAADIIPYSGRV